MVKNNILVRFLEDGVFFVCENNKKHHKLFQGQHQVRWSDNHFYHAEILAVGTKHDLLLIRNSLEKNVPFVLVNKSNFEEITNGKKCEFFHPVFVDSASNNEMISSIIDLPTEPKHNELVNTTCILEETKMPEKTNPNNGLTNTVMTLLDNEFESEDELCGGQNIDNLDIRTEKVFSDKFESEEYFVCSLCGLLVHNLNRHIEEEHGRTKGNANNLQPNKPFYNIHNISNEIYTRENDSNINKVMSIETCVGNSKKYFCIYCKKLFSKIAVHLVKMHSQENDVQKFSILPKGCSERKHLIDIIRKRGCFEYNNNEAYNNGNLIVARRSKHLKERNEYKLCPHCKGFFSKFTIRKHYPKCIPKYIKGDRSINIMGKILNDDIHSAASPMLRKIFVTLREDEVKRVIRYDNLVITFGNMLCEKYRLQHLHKMIRAKLRLVGRFLLEIKKNDKEIDNYSSVFAPEKIDNILIAVNKIGVLDNNAKKYKSPATASALGTILKKCAKLLISLCIKKRDNEKKVLVEDFLKVFEEDFPTFISKTVMETQLQNKRKKNIVLPSTSDIKLLNNYVEESRYKYFKELQVNFKFHIWKELASFTLISIQIFNRRRAGEVERITIEDFENFQSIDDKENYDVLDLNEESCAKNSKKYVRFLIRGKKARGVPVLLSKQMLRSVQLILKYRSEAGVPEENPFVFGIPGNSTTFTYLSACDLMRRFASECKSSRPELLRGTQLRKHLATQSALLDLNENEVNDLANFMGHADKIHREHYRIPVVTREIGRVSKLLEIGVGQRTNKSEEHVTCSFQNSPNEDDGFTWKDRGHEKCEENAEISQDFWTDDGYTLYGREHCVSPLGNIKRRSWSTPEIRCAKKIFSEHIDLGESPSLPECVKAIKGNLELNTRTPNQLKAWIVNQINKNRRRLTKSRVYWSDEEKTIMFNEFKKNLEDRILPGLKYCADIRAKYKILEKRNPYSMKAWVHNTLKKNRKKN
ncbi:uncharacterized protein isoform X2 [Leptinotarsa decemlineata]|uniref:uncharacterized protein isoform X2 n=1 Tax=Leptinotarsa decemlineata TaxID=7539 RepID=UPI003D3093A5